MQILIVNGSESWGVDGRLHLTLAGALAQRGHAVTLAGLDGGPWLQHGSAEGLPCTSLQLPGHFSLEARRRIRTLVSDAGVEVVHTCRLQDLWSLAAVRGTRRHPPVVLTSYLAPTVDPRRLWYRSLRRAVAAYTAPTPLLQRVAARDLGIPVEQVHLLPHFVDVPRYGGEEVRGRAAALRRTWGVPPQVPVVGTLLPLRPGYGVELFIEAARLAEPHVGKAVWVVVPWPGTVDEAYRRNLQERSRGSPFLKIAEPEEDTAAVLHALDIFLFPTEREGYARSLLEAMTAGIPVIGVEGPASAFVIEQERSGLLVNPRDPLGLAGGVAQILGDPDLRQRLSREGRQRVLASFSQEGVLDRYEALYANLLA